MKNSYWVSRGQGSIINGLSGHALGALQWLMSPRRSSRNQGM